MKMLREVKEEFLEHLKLKNSSETTIKDYKSQLENWIDWLESQYNRPVAIEEVDKGELEDYFVYLKNVRECSPSYRNKILYILRSLYNYAEKKDITDNVARKIEKAKTRKKKKDFFRPEEMKKVLDEIENPVIWHTVNFLYRTGGRMGECLSVEISDLDFNNKSITIRQGKGNKDRTIAMSAELEKDLNWYLDKIRPDVDNDKLFVTRKSSGLSSRHVNKRLKRAVEGAGIDKDITAHNIRRSTAISLINEGVGLHVVRDYLGHTNIKTTSTYLSSDLSDQRSAVEVL